MHNDLWLSVITQTSQTSIKRLAESPSVHDIRAVSGHAQIERLESARERGERYKRARLVRLKCLEIGTSFHEVRDEPCRRPRYRDVLHTSRRPLGETSPQVRPSQPSRELREDGPGVPETYLEMRDVRGEDDESELVKEVVEAPVDVLDADFAEVREEIEHADRVKRC